MTEEQKRVQESKRNPDGWRHWGPYLAERAWGTVREDYSPDGSAWDYFPHDHARSRAYRWNEDGLGGICDIRQYLCFAVTLWNGKDPILKERLFGLTGPQGNHGEDVKEYYYYRDATPTHSYLKFLYKYPHVAFPYSLLEKENARRRRNVPEYELLDTGVFEGDRYFDLEVEYAKATSQDICIRITAHNRGPEDAPLHLLPTLWFRNTWTWEPEIPRPRLARWSDRVIHATHPELGERYLIVEDAPGCEAQLFTENDTNVQRLFGQPNVTPFVKDAFHRYVIDREDDAVNPELCGTKGAFWYRLNIPAGTSAMLRFRLTDVMPANGDAATIGADFDSLFTTRITEADAFYASLAMPDTNPDALAVQRQAYAGLIWTKQFYNFDMDRWLDGDPDLYPPPAQRKQGRNYEWRHVSCTDVLSMPDKWEYPWFAAWDLAFHMIPFAQIDPDFAKHQLLMLCREWYMHPNGQLPAYEWAFGDVNPPVHAWAALRVYQIERKAKNLPPEAPGDVDFLERVFHKLLLNFTWWVNRKDAQGNNIFEGGFLGLDNIGVFDRSAPLPTGGFIEQSDGTAWMAMYCLNMLAIALELTCRDPTYEDVATKFAEHFVYIAHALNNIGDNNVSLWDEDDGFYYDVLHLPDGTSRRLRLRSLVGILPLLAVEAFAAEALARAPDFMRRLQWFLGHKPQLARSVAHLSERGQEQRALFSIVDQDRLQRILQRLFDENEFLGPFGIRSLSRYHRDQPYILNLEGHAYRVDYAPAESTSGMFGGNSNWRGPVWFPLNYLIVEALQRYDFVYGPSFKVEFPTGSGRLVTLGEAAAELSRRLTRTFLRGEDGRRPVWGDSERFQTDPHWRDHLLFYEYFHGDNGMGLGASHQTGWTALVAKLISQSGS